MRPKKSVRRLSVEKLEQRALLAVLTVTSVNDSGTGSLRAAIESANLDSTPDTIQFALPGSGVRTIDLLSPLPGVFNPVQIDGWSQSGFAGSPLIQLQAAAAIDYGISLFANDSLIRGLIFTGFDNSHLAIWGGDNNKIQGNYFGTNPAGTALAGGNTIFDAVFIGDGSVNNIVGIDGNNVTDAQERNIIGGGQSGIGLWGATSTGNRIAGNYIGTNASGADLGNQFGGVWLDAGANQNFIGSNNDGFGDGVEGNIISRNRTHGIVINGSSTQNNRISRNLVYGNALMEIDLGNNGADVNDVLDADSGPNALANKPELTSLSLLSASFIVGGSLAAEASKSYRIELFSAATRDNSGFGGAQKFLAAFVLTTDASGQANFNRTITASVDFGWVITATATDPSGNTSEFSIPIWDGVNLAQTFALSSLPSASQTIYLDFNGHTTTGTLWNSTYNQPTINTPAYSLDGQAAFSNQELLRIQGIYQRVVEDFRPFNVNVTTQEPPLGDLIKSGVTDLRWGIRVAIGGAWTDWLGSSAGGIAWNSSFNWDSDTPVFVFSINNANSAEDLTAEAISHEVGHSLGLSHDGTPGSEYYFGHGTGTTSWNTIMGGGSAAQVTQWSRGQYLNASNSEDDLSIITTQNGFGYRVDDYGNSLATAARLTTVATRVQQTGLISTTADRDFFYFDTTGGLMDLRFGVAQIGANLDLFVRLYDSAGAVIGSNNPVEELTARIARTLPAGRYYLSIDGVGKGSPLTVADGYTDYGSLGFYSITGTYAGMNLGPALGGIGTSAIAYPNNTGARLVAAAATVSDSDSPDFAGGVLTIAITAGFDESNRINLATGVFTRSGRDVLFNGTVIGSVNPSAGIGLTNFQVTFNSAATASIVQQLIRAVNFRTISNTNPSQRRLSFTLSDGDGGVSQTLNVAINVS